jgi:hypothetical protein
MKRLKVHAFGEPYDEQMFQLVELWDTILRLEPHVGRIDPRFLDTFGTRHCGFRPTAEGFNTEFIRAKLRQAMETTDASFFRRLADTIERTGKPSVDPLRVYLVNRFYVELSQDGTAAKGFENIEIPRNEITLRQLHNEMKEHGIRCDERQLRRACKDLGIVLVKDRRGRPKGKRGQSRDPK